jgi:hypothetical protein
VEPAGARKAAKRRQELFVDLEDARVFRRQDLVAALDDGRIVRFLREAETRELDARLQEIRPQLAALIVRRTVRKNLGDDFGEDKVQKRCRLLRKGRGEIVRRHNRIEEPPDVREKAFELPGGVD